MHDNGAGGVRVGGGAGPDEGEDREGVIWGAVVRPVGVVVLEDGALYAPRFSALNLRRARG